MGVSTPETCSAVNKLQDNKLEKLLHLVGDLFELNYFLLLNCYVAKHFHPFQCYDYAKIRFSASFAVNKMAANMSHCVWLAGLQGLIQEIKRVYQLCH